MEAILIAVLPVAVAEFGRWLKYRHKTELESLRKQVAGLAARVEELERAARWRP